MALKPKKKNHYTKPLRQRPLNLRDAAAWTGLTTGFAALLAVFALAFVLVHDVLTQSQYFAVSHIVVSGNKKISSEKILEQAGLKKGMNILSVNLPMAQNRLMAYPWICAASVSRVFPDRIAVRISEREPLAILDLGQRFLVDTNGKIFKRQEATDPGGLPLVTGLSFADVSLAGEPRQRAYDAAIRFLLEQRKNQWAVTASKTPEVRVDPDMGLTLVTSGPAVKVRLGFGDYMNKMRRLEIVMASCRRIGDLKPATVNLVDLERVTVGLEKLPSAGTSNEAGRSSHA